MKKYLYLLLVFAFTTAMAQSDNGKISKWETHKDKNYKFAIKFPRGAQVSETETASGEGTSFRRNIEWKNNDDQYFTGFGIVAVLFKQGEDLNVMSEKIAAEYPNHTKGVITIAGQKAIHLHLGQQGLTGQPLNIIIFTDRDNQYVYVLMCISLEPGGEKLIRKFIGSFKFIK